MSKLVTIRNHIPRADKLFIVKAKERQEDEDFGEDPADPGTGPPGGPPPPCDPPVCGGSGGGGGDDDCIPILPGDKFEWTPAAVSYVYEMAGANVSDLGQFGTPTSVSTSHDSIPANKRQYLVLYTFSQPGATRFRFNPVLHPLGSGPALAGHPKIVYVTATAPDTSVEGALMRFESWPPSGYDPVGTQLFGFRFDFVPSVPTVSPDYEIPPLMYPVSHISGGTNVAIYLKLLEPQGSDKGASVETNSLTYIIEFGIPNGQSELLRDDFQRIGPELGDDWFNVTNLSIVGAVLRAEPDTFGDAYHMLAPMVGVPSLVEFDFWVPPDPSDGYHAYELDADGHFIYIENSPNTFIDFEVTDWNVNFAGTSTNPPNASLNFTPESDTWYRVKAYQSFNSGGALKCKVWKVGGTEPDWMVETTSDTEAEHQENHYVYLDAQGSIYPSLMDNIQIKALEYVDCVSHTYSGATVGPVRFAAGDGYYYPPNNIPMQDTRQVWFDGVPALKGTHYLVADGHIVPTTELDADTQVLVRYIAF